MNTVLTLEGRIGRRDWWVFSTVLVIAWCALAAVLHHVLVNTHLFAATTNIQIMASLPFAWPLAALGVRRLHDLGRSAWWTLGPYGLIFVPQYVFALATLTPLYWGKVLMLWVLSLTLSGIGLLWAIIQCGMLPGGANDNPFGPARDRVSNASKSENDVQGAKDPR